MIWNCGGGGQIFCTRTDRHWGQPRQKISPPPGLDPRSVQPVASRYTDWAIPTHFNNNTKNLRSSDIVVFPLFFLPSRFTQLNACSDLKILFSLCLTPYSSPTAPCRLTLRTNGLPPLLNKLKCIIDNFGKPRRRLEDNIKTKPILDAGVWTRCIWFRIRTSGIVFDFHKMRWNSE
jgi:hypothetical protein